MSLRRRKLPWGMLPGNHKPHLPFAVDSPERLSRDGLWVLHPIRSAHRCFAMRVSEAETCWFSSRKPVHINVSLARFWRIAEQEWRYLTGGIEGKVNFLEVGDVWRQDSLPVRKMDTALTLWRIAVTVVGSTPVLKKRTLIRPVPSFLCVIKSLSPHLGLGRYKCPHHLFCLR